MPLLVKLRNSLARNMLLTSHVMLTEKRAWLQNVPSCPIVWMVWAESFRDASPSLLLGYALLTSRRESALFLRMATGFGFAQV